MEISVTEYMNNRAVLIKKVSLSVLVQFWALGVFILLYSLLQSELIPSRNLENSSMAVKIFCLFVTIVIVTVNIIICRGFEKLHKQTWSEEEVRLTKDVLIEAYSVAKNVLWCNITAGILLELLGVLSWLIARIVFDNSETGEIYSRIGFLLFSGIALFLIIQAVDRTKVYEMFLDNTHVLIDHDRLGAIFWIAAVIVPIGCFAFYYCRYYSAFGEYAWTVWFGMVITIGVLGMLVEYLKIREHNIESDDK